MVLNMIVTQIKNKIERLLNHSIMSFGLLIFCLLLTPHTLFADSDGYFSAGKDVIAYERWFDDPEHIFLIAFGGSEGISNPIPFKLPIKITMNVQSIEFKSDTLLVILREIKREKNESGKFVIIKDELHYIEIDVIEPISPRLIKYYQKPFDKNEKLKPPQGNLGHLARMDKFALETNDTIYTYEIVFKHKILDKKAISPTSGVIYHEYETLILQKNKQGQVIKEKKIYNENFEETID